MVYRHPDAPRRKERAYSEEGVDLTQIRRLALLTPSERLRELEGFLSDLDDLRRSAHRCSSERS